MSGITPLFLPGPSGQLFSVIYYPGNEELGNHWVLLFPPFAEEMNKSRHMIASQARAWAGKGYCVLVPDYYGTGDSLGDFSEVDWASWRQDAHYLLDWICTHNPKSISLWGLRAGCLMIADIISSCDGKLSVPLTHLVFWQPMMSGEQLVNQFLRLRVAQSMTGGEKVTVTELRQHLSEQQTLEISGYTLRSTMASQLDAVSLKSFSPPPDVRLTLFEVGARSDKPLTVAAAKLVEEWTASGSTVDARVVSGEPFWTTQELAGSVDLITESTAALPDVSADVTTSESCAVFLPTDSQGGTEQPVVFECMGKHLVGILHRPQSDARCGVLLVVGGPQYRVGSHRQFALLARYLAAQGIPVFRFDYRGMGDSEGEFIGFEGISADIKAATDCFSAAAAVNDIVIWGLCDAATAAAFYASGDPRIKGLALLNPWVRSETGEARTFLRHYYLQRFFSRAFWQKVASGEFKFFSSLKALLGKINQSFSAKPAEISSGDGSTQATRSSTNDTGLPLAERLFSGLKNFNGQALLILSGNDLTAAEFRDAMQGNRKYSRLLHSRNCQIREIAEADHTFSKRQWKDQVAEWTAVWVRNI